jgi:DNA-binding PadR family transcriptional regulator
MNDRTAFQRDLPYVICRYNRPHGLALKDALEEYHDDEINPGCLYSNLGAFS